MSDAPFRCPACGGQVARGPAPAGLTWSLRPKHPLPVPATVQVPSCDGCEEVYLGPEDERALTRAVRPQALAEQAREVGQHVETLRARHGVTLRQIEAALAVTPSYLSHLLAGRKLASETLLRLLAIFAKHPAAFPHPVQCAPESVRAVRLVASYGATVDAWGSGVAPSPAPAWKPSSDPGAAAADTALTAAS